MENKEVVVVQTLADLEAACSMQTDLSGPEHKLASEACCDQCCDDYICSSD